MRNGNQEIDISIQYMSHEKCGPFQLNLNTSHSSQIIQFSLLVNEQKSICLNSSSYKFLNYFSDFGDK